MKKVIRIFVMLMALNIFVASYYQVLAQTSMRMKASLEPKTINTGDEIEVQLSIDDLNEIGDGVNAYVLTLNFNREQFEFIRAEGQNNWNSPMYNQQSLETGKIKMAATRPSFVKEKSEFLTITLKSKQNFTSSNVLDISIIDTSFAAKIDGETVKINIPELKIETEGDKDKEEEETKKQPTQEPPKTLPNAGRKIIGSVIFIIFIYSIIYYCRYIRLRKYIK